ncbi:MAG TPA: hypothetical protein VF389_02820, partial [Woeseiaceae bacterium]
VRGGAINYQPDVIIVEGGARSIRGMGQDALTWTIDAGAAGAGQVAEGKIVFVTGRCVGRVLASRRVGDDLIVILGPVELTDVIRDCDIELEEPLDLGQPTVLAAPAFPGSETDLSPLVPWQNTEPADDLPDLASWRQLPYAGPEGNAAFTPALYRPQQANNGWAYRQVSGSTLPANFAVTPEAGPGGIGIRTQAWNSEMNMVFVAKLRLGTPSIRFSLKIGLGKIIEATLRLSGSAGLRIGFVAKTEGGATANINAPGRIVPMELNIPLFGLGGLPLGAAIQQRFLVQSAFSAKNSYLRAISDYTLGGDLYFGYRNGGFQAGGPGITAINESLLTGIKGISFGASGMVLAHHVRLMVGIGGLGFSAGPYVGLTSSTGIARGSDLARPVQPNVCRTATLVMDVAPGIGYQIPQVVADGINFFLRLVNARTIQRSGGIQGSPLRLLNRTSYTPDTQLCREAAGGTTAPNSGSSGGGGPPPPDAPGQGRGAQPGQEETPGPGSESAPDINVICGNPETQRQLREHGVDVEKLCEGSSSRM